MLSGGVTSLSSSNCAVSALGAARNITHAAARIMVRAATDSLPELFTPDRNALIFKILRMQKRRVRIQTKDSGRVNGTKVGAADDQGGSLVLAEAAIWGCLLFRRCQADIRRKRQERRD